jgi:hypothetical protein
MKKHYNLTTTEDNGKSITTTNTSSEYPDEIVRLLALAGQGMPQVAPAPAEDNCGCGQTPCVSAEASVEEAEYEATPANDKLDLDDFSKKTANSISRQKKSLKPSAGDNPLEYSVNEEEIYDALMADAQEFGLVDESFSDQVRDFGMFSKGGNAQVQNMIQYILNRLEQELDELAEDEPDMEEAADTEVRERAMRELEGLLAGLE